MYEKLQKLMKDKHIKPAELSRSTGIAPSSLSDWKSGRSKPKLDKLQLLADYFGVPVSYFTDEEPSVNADNKKTPKELRKLLESEEITLNGRLFSAEDKEKMLKIVEAAFWDAKEMNKRKK